MMSAPAAAKAELAAIRAELNSNPAQLFGDNFEALLRDLNNELTVAD